MSIMQCDECHNFVDTDFHTMEAEETKYGDKNICEACVERLGIETDKAQA